MQKYIIDEDKTDEWYDMILIWLCENFYLHVKFIDWKKNHVRFHNKYRVNMSIIIIYVFLFLFMLEIDISI